MSSSHLEENCQITKESRGEAAAALCPIGTTWAENIFICRFHAVHVSFLDLL